MCTHIHLYTRIQTHSHTRNHTYTDSLTDIHSNTHTHTQTHARTPLDPEGIKCNNPHATLYVVAGDTGSQGNRSLWEQGNAMGKADAYGEHYIVIKGEEQE